MNSWSSYQKKMENSIVPLNAKNGTETISPYHYVADNIRCYNGYYFWGGVSAGDGLVSLKGEVFLIIFLTTKGVTLVAIFLPSFFR